MLILSMAESKTSKSIKNNADYEVALSDLHKELVHLQEWVKNQGLKVVIIFEGRDASGKGGTIKRFTEPLNPRVCKVANVRIREDFPAPFGPKRPNIPCGMFNVTFFSA